MQLWTKMHAITLIPSFIVMVLFAILLARLIGNKDEKIRMIPIQIIAVIIIVIEIIKQVQSLVEGYDLYFIPLHFCSLFIFFIPLFAFYKGKGKEYIRSFAVIASAMMSVFLLVYPDLIYSAGNVLNMGKEFLSFHTVVFHNLVLFAFVLIIALKLYNFNAKRDIKVILIGFSIYCVVAASMAQILKTNYNNFYTCNIGPIANFVETVKDKIGYVAGQTLYVSIVIVLDMLFAFISYGALRLITKIREIKRNKT